MTSAPNLLFPYVLDTLSQKPEMCEVQRVLLKDVSDQLKKEGLKVTNLKRELEATIEMGKDLGVLTVQKEIVRMPRKNTRDVNWTRSTMDVSDNEDSKTRKRSVPRTAKEAKMGSARGRSKSSRKPNKRMARGRSEVKSRSPKRSRGISRGSK